MGAYIRSWPLIDGPRLSAPREPRRSSSTTVSAFYICCLSIITHSPPSFCSCATLPTLVTKPTLTTPPQKVRFGHGPPSEPTFSFLRIHVLMLSASTACMVPFTWETPSEAKRTERSRERESFHWWTCRSFKLFSENLHSNMLLFNLYDWNLVFERNQCSWLLIILRFWLEIRKFSDLRRFRNLVLGKELYDIVSWHCNYKILLVIPVTRNLVFERN